MFIDIKQKPIKQTLELNIEARKYKEFEPYIPRNIILLARELAFVGSRVICTPAPTDTDLDILMLGNANMGPKYIGQTIGQWCDKHDGKYPDGYFTSFRKGEVNLLLTFNRLWYMKFLKAVEVCKMLNVQDKKQRIKVHHMILGVPDDGGYIPPVAGDQLAAAIGGDGPAPGAADVILQNLGDEIMVDNV